MRKILLAALIIAATLIPVLAQENNSNPPSQGRAPKEANGVGRADVRVLDSNGNPVKGAYVKLESTRSDGFFCESWGTTDADGVIVLPPIHMGTLKMIVKAKGYKTEKIEVLASNLNDPVRVTLAKK